MHFKKPSGVGAVEWRVIEKHGVKMLTDASHSHVHCFPIPESRAFFPGGTEAWSSRSSSWKEGEELLFQWVSA